MIQLYGEYDGTVDSKGRMKMPAALLKQLAGTGPYKFFVNRGFEQCLMLYPEKVWEEKIEEVNKLNIYKTQEREFVRYFYRGVRDVLTDSVDRLLLPKSMLDHAGIKKEVIIFAYMNNIELWDRDRYLSTLSKEPSDYSRLADQVWGGQADSDKP